MDMHASKTLCTLTGLYTSGAFYVQEPMREVSGPYCEGWGSRCIKELNSLARTAPPITKLIRNEEETVRYIICASGA
jgi:hypothetical protein